jgi:hypothetical protein
MASGTSPLQLDHALEAAVDHASGVERHLVHVGLDPGSARTFFTTASRCRRERWVIQEKTTTSPSFSFTARVNEVCLPFGTAGSIPRRRLEERHPTCSPLESSSFGLST